MEFFKPCFILLYNCNIIIIVNLYCRINKILFQKINYIHIFNHYLLPQSMYFNF